MSERLEAQLKFFVSRSMYPTAKERDEAIAEARAHFIETGEEIPGVRIVGRFRNPDRRNPVRAQWKTTEDPGQSLQDFYKTLNVGTSSLGDRLGSVSPRAVRRIQLERLPAPSLSMRRSSAMRLYHAAVRKIALKHPKWTYARARREYRKRKK